MSAESSGLEPAGPGRTWGMVCHLAALVGIVVPFGGIVAPLVIWLVKRGEHPFADDQGKESLNFQITVFIVAIVCVVLAIVGIGFILLGLLSVLNLVFIIVATVKSSGGERYRYPFAIRLIQ